MKQGANRMNKKGNSKSRRFRVFTAVRMLAEALFLAIFIVLTAMGRINLWMGVFLAGLALSVFFGRIYCGWACPMATLMRPIAFVYQKLGIKRISGPRFLTNAYVRYGLLAATLVAMMLVKRSGSEFPLLPAVVVLSLVVSLVFEESFWHAHLCPYGTILNLISRFSRWGESASRHRRASPAASAKKRAPRRLSVPAKTANVRLSPGTAWSAANVSIPVRPAPSATAGWIRGRRRFDQKGGLLQRSAEGRPEPPSPGAQNKWNCDGHLLAK